MRVRAINQKKYGISKHRFYELMHFCLQYHEWKDELKYNTDTLKSKEISDMPQGGERKKAIEELAMRRVMLQRKCDLIEETAEEADGDIKDYIVKAVTNEGISFTYLSTVMRIPCSRTNFYEKRRKFFYLLDKKYKGARS